MIVGWKGVWPSVRRFIYHARGLPSPDGGAGGYHSKVWQEHVINRLPEKDQGKIKNWARFFLAFNLVFIVACIATGWWILPLLTTFASFFGAHLVVMCGLSQHMGLMKNVRDFRLNCRTFTSTRLVMLLYWNMNYHIEHHSYVAVPCYNLPRLHKAMKPHLPPVHTSLREVWIEIFAIQQRQKREPGYEYRQPLPEETGDAVAEDGA